MGGSRFEHTKLKSAIDTSLSFDCDLFCQGHVHSLAETTLLSQAIDMRSKTVVEKKKWILLTGHYLKYGGYAQNAGMRPSKMGSPKVKFHTEKKDITITW